MMTDGQLSLSLEPPAGPDRQASRLPLPAFDTGLGPFDDLGYFFEPWWPGARAWLERHGHRIDIRTEHLADPAIAFPELADLPDDLAADDVLLEGTLLALDREGRPDPQLLRARLAGEVVPTDRSGRGEAAFVASDVVYEGGRSMAGLAFAERRRRLAEVVRDGERLVIARGLTGEGTTLARAVASLGLDAIAARRLDARWRAEGGSGDRIRLPVLEAPAVPARPLLVLLARLPLDG